MFRLAPVAALLLACASCTTVIAAESDVTDLSLAQMRQALDDGTITSQQLVETYLDRIEKNDKQGAQIHAIVTLNEQALAQAQAWDAKRRQHPHASQPALAGIPFLAKDNFDTAGILTTGGSLALNDSVPTSNAHVLQNLLDEGAILLGKTNMSELAASYGWLGYSSFGGQTLNPFNPLRDASGSSSGSAAAVAAHFAPFALGSDTGGSVRAPASVTGMVGLRPTLGLFSRSGIIPLSLTSDTAGIITRSVADQALVARVMAGPDDQDAATQWQDADGSIDLSGPLDEAALRGKTLLAVDNFDGGNDEVDKIKERAIATLTAAGARVQTITLPLAFETLWSDVLGPVGEAEFKPQFERYLASLPGSSPKTLDAFISRLEALSAESETPVNPGRLKGLKQANTTLLTDSPDYITRLSRRIPAIRQALSRILQDANADAIIFPTMSCPASVVHDKNDPSYVCRSSDPYAPSYIASVTGFPEVTVNAGMATGHMPVGLSFLGAERSDALMLDLAYAFEQAHDAPPIRNPLAVER